MWSDSIAECFFQACEWLNLCGRNGIVLNPEKFVLAQDIVEFAGFGITLDEVTPCWKYIDAIHQFPTPQNITDIKSWFGLVNQVSYYTSMTEKMRPFRNLLKPKTPFYWDNQLQQLCDECKRSIINDIQHGVTIFDKTRKTCLTTDWSKKGIGFFLLQKHCSCTSDTPFCCKNGWKVTLLGSRFAHPTGSRYAPIEAVAVVDSLERARYFLLGCSDLIVAVDHKPLLQIFGDRKLEDIKKPRLLNLKEKTLPFRFKIVHIPGKRNIATDAISRHPVNSREITAMNLPDDANNKASSPDDELVIVSQSAILQPLRTDEPDWSADLEAKGAVNAAHALNDIQV